MFNKDFNFCSNFFGSCSDFCFTPKSQSSSSNALSNPAQGNLAGHDIAVSSPRSRPDGLPDELAFPHSPRMVFDESSLQSRQLICGGFTDVFNSPNADMPRGRLEAHAALTARFADGSGNHYELDLIEGSLNKNGPDAAKAVVLRSSTGARSGKPMTLSGLRLNFFRTLLTVLSQEKQLTGKPRLSIAEFRESAKRYGGSYRVPKIISLSSEINRILAGNNVTNLIVCGTGEDHESSIPIRMNNGLQYIEIGDNVSFSYSNQPARKRDDKQDRKSPEAKTWSDDVLRRLTTLDPEQREDFLLHVMELSTPCRDDEDFPSYTRRVYVNVRFAQAMDDSALLSVLLRLERQSPGTASEIFDAIKKSDSPLDREMIKPRIIEPRGRQ